MCSQPQHPPQTTYVQHVEAEDCVQHQWACTKSMEGAQDGHIRQSAALFGKFSDARFSLAFVLWSSAFESYRQDAQDISAARLCSSGAKAVLSRGACRAWESAPVPLQAQSMTVLWMVRGVQNNSRESHHWRMLFEVDGYAIFASPDQAVQHNG